MSGGSWARLFTGAMDLLTATAPVLEFGSDDEIVWYDCKSPVVEGKGWTDTKAFYDRLLAKAGCKQQMKAKRWGNDRTLPLGT